jgi:fructokinase
MRTIFGGVETGGTWVVCAVGTGPHDIVAQETFATAEPEPTLERIVAFFERGPRPAAIGVGSFGPVDLDRRSETWGHVTSTPKPGWAHTPVAPVLRDRLGIPVAFDTDVTAAAIGEHRWGAAAGVDSVCYLTIGTGIGAGLLIEGRPVHGLIHPEVGHLRIPHDRARDPFTGNCPRHGDCWEGLAAGGAIAARWDANPRELPDDHPAWALEAEYVALGLLAIVLVASPQRVVACWPAPGPGWWSSMPGISRRRCSAPRSTATWSLRRWATARACWGRSRWRSRPPLTDRALLRLPVD